ncbi:dihydropteroate synthase [Cryptococcus wingfieldii CBS 7118]|uniref:Dihydropteroate synthase n=1 Tax=Cryptococcus wingfieldii CBS 7118 TaxID=1295528 RepID=A0A1E3K2W9_9TREE|nr:dihydropteroate synthase [Cryptococcus wingfieldii CBS 7118]ODO07366.1 dihydropteroate synthase [Cryptococcus wingfieldii CBS 7118]
MPADTINIASLAVHLPNGLGPSAFHLTPPPPCPVSISLTIHLFPGSVKATSEGDDMTGLGVNYSAVSKAVYALAGGQEKVWGDAWELMRAVSEIPLDLPDVQSVDVRIGLPKALLHAMEAVYTAMYTKTGGLVEESRSSEIRDLKVVCIVGLHPHERKEKQRLEVDVRAYDCDWNAWGHKGFADQVYEFVSNSEYGTIESLDHELGHSLLSSKYLGSGNTPRLQITIRKPSAIPFATPGITIHRTHSDYSPTPSTSQECTGSERVFIAVGGNIGDTVSNIKTAVGLLQSGGCNLIATSRLYESEPMYVEDQDRFVNGVIEVTTSLEPLDLLRLLKRTERATGRTKTFTNGPRVVDLDLVFYGQRVLKIGSETDAEDADGVRWLECPHARLGEREFVLRPLADIDASFTHPAVGKSISQLLDSLPDPSSLGPMIPLRTHSRSLRLSSPATPRIMAIFNATPDSFSDGDPSRTSTKHALEECLKLIEQGGADILDIGGMSTRPGSEPCTETEEVERVVPLIAAIRQHSNTKLARIPISVDTYRASVAEQAVAAGASIINDVRGGREPGMLAVMSAADVPVVLMHSRGDSKTMTSAESQDYTALGGVVEGVKKEMAETVELALKAGVKRWNIIVDPGLGFAKSGSQSLTLLRRLLELVSSSSPLHNYPLLVGASRKGFVGQVTGRTVAKERSYGDAGVSAWCVGSGGVDILRVHASGEMGDVVKMVQAIRDAE